MQNVSTKRIIKDRVAGLLQAKERARHDDGYLIAILWYNDLVKKGLSKEAAKNVAQIVANGDLTHSESIRRCRQKLQQENPELYGRSESRAARSEEVKQELRG